MAATETYPVRVPAPAASAGKKSAATVSITPKKGWKLNLEFPTKLVVEPPAGASVDKKKQKKADAASFSEKKGAIWRVVFTANKAGKNTFSADLKFAMCSSATCDPKRETFRFDVGVK